MKRWIFALISVMLLWLTACAPASEIHVPNDTCDLTYDMTDYAHFADIFDEQEAEGKPRVLEVTCQFCSEHYTFTEEELLDIPEDAVKHKKITPYGAEAIVKRDLLPDGYSVSAVGLEELFVSMIKENK